MTAGSTLATETAAPDARRAPFDLPGGPDAVLLLHGLTGSPYEMRFVAERLHGAGLRCVGPVMTGHDGGPRALLATTWRDWLDGARRDLRRLDAARRVALVGCSMGSLVGCALAAAEPERIAGLVLLAPALHLARAARLAAFLGGRAAVRRWWPVVPKAGGSDVADPEQRRVNPTMAAVPLPAVSELVDLSRHVDALLPAVRAPTLIVAGRHDHTVRLSGARRMAARLGSAPARLVILERSFHLVGIDVDRERCADEVTAFLETTLAAGGGSGHGGEAWRRT